MDQHRKNAKRLLRGFRSSEPEAERRAEAVLAGRARERFQLSDAQHVVAVEHGYRTWPELVREETREDQVVDTGLAYAPDDPVLVRVVRHGRRVRTTDDGRAATKAGRTKVPEEIARRVENEFIVNVSRRGEIFLPGGQLVGRIANASLALYQELLELE